MSGADRAQLLFVHGIGGVRDATGSRRQWLVALAEGARRAGHADAVSGLTQDWLAETRFADYSRLFLDPGAQGDNGRLEEQSDFLVALVAEMITELSAQAHDSGDQQTLSVLEAARRQLPGATGEPQGAPEVVRVLGRALTTFLQIPGLRKSAQWVSGRPLLGQLAQVGRYLGRGEPDDAGMALDARIRRCVLHGVDPSRPLVVVAHSLGTVVAYEALHQYPGQVALLVTLGSPLATGAAVLQRVRPRPARTPEAVERWINFWDRDDIVVARPKMHKWVLPSRTGVVPVTSRIDSDGVWVHTATKYLCQPAVAGPIVEALKK